MAEAGLWVLAVLAMAAGAGMMGDVIVRWRTGA